MRMVSVFGDSISTYDGFNPAGYAVYYDRETQERNGLRTVYDAWWAKVNQALHAYLCVNGFYSGSRVTGMGFPSAISERRLDHLGTLHDMPDIILVYLGFNDFGNGVQPFGKQSGGLPGMDLCVFQDAYGYILMILAERYPDAQIVCGTLMRTRIKGIAEWVFPEKYAGVPFEEYNKAIRSAVEVKQCYLADLSATGIRYETLDGTHPTVIGHREIASAWITCLARLNML